MPTGDTRQSDIPGLSGLEDAVTRLDGLPGVGVTRFDRGDVVRSGFCQQVLGMDRVMYAMDYPYQYNAAEVVVTDEMALQYVHGKNGACEVRSQGEGGWKLHVVGRTEVVAATGEGRRGKEEQQVAWEGVGEVRDEELWDKMAGVKFGRSFRWIWKCQQLGTNKERALCMLRAPKGWGGSVMRVPVELVDTLFQTVSLVNLSRRGGGKGRGGEESTGEGGFMAPFAMEDIAVRVDGDKMEATSQEEIVSETVFEGGTERTVRLRSRLTQGGKDVVRMEGLTLAQASEEAFLGQKSSEGRLRELMYEVVWEEEKGAEREEGEAMEKVGVIVGSEEVMRRVEEEMGRGGGGGGKVVKKVMGREADAEVGEEEEVWGVRVVVNAVAVGAKGQAMVRMALACMRRLMREHRRGGVTDRVVYTVVERAHRVAEKRGMDPWARAVWSMGRTFGQEGGERMRHVLVDVEDARCSGLGREVMEIKAVRGGEIALREKKRYAAVLEHFGNKEESSRVLRGGGLVVVSGGYEEM